MENMMISAVLVILIMVFSFYVLSIYNSLVKIKVNIQEAWSGVDVQLKRRVDLIPNLVETVKGYATHEQKVFDDVTKARSALMGATTPGESDSANNMLTGALKTLFAVAEAYPDLKATDNFKHLQQELTDTESKIAYSRQFYNSNVKDYNTKIVVFPNSMVASIFKFKQEEFFEASAIDREPVKVEFNK